MLQFESGIIGFPLRLLAREVYEKCIQKVGAEKVALITGEEKIIPPYADYFLCTVESCLLYTSPSPRDGLLSRMPSSA